MEVIPWSGFKIWANIINWHKICLNHAERYKEEDQLEELFISGAYYDVHQIEGQVTDLVEVSSIGPNRDFTLCFSEKLNRYLEKGPFGLYGAVCYRVLDIDKATEWDTSDYVTAES